MKRPVFRAPDLECQAATRMAAIPGGGIWRRASGQRLETGAFINLDIHRLFHIILYFLKYQPHDIVF